MESATVTGFRGKAFDAMTREEAIDACKILAARLFAVLDGHIEPIDKLGKLISDSATKAA